MAVVEVHFLGRIFVHVEQLVRSIESPEKDATFLLRKILALEIDLNISRHVGKQVCEAKHVRFGHELWRP